MKYSRLYALGSRRPPRISQNSWNPIPCLGIPTNQFSTSTMSPPGIRIQKLRREMYDEEIVIKTEDLKRQDERPDAEWYGTPRLVHHIDEGAVETLTSYYSSSISNSSSVLDICSSWVSHLPSSLKPKVMIGIGMNAYELQKNPHLTKFIVRDLNATPKFEEMEDSSVDTVICSVSVDYLTKPVEIFGEMNRVLKPGGTAHMAFSNRCFPTKVVGRWLGLGDEARRHWVGGYFWASDSEIRKSKNGGGWQDVEEIILKEGSRGFMGMGGEDPLYVVRAVKAAHSNI